MEEVIEANIQAPGGQTEQVVLHRAGWQQRYIDPEYGASSWQCCNEETAEILAGRYDYQLRAIFAIVSPSSDTNLRESAQGAPTAGKVEP